MCIRDSGYRMDAYSRDLFREDLDQLPPADDGLRNIHDVLDFASAWAAPLPLGDIARAFPELHNRAIERGQASEMYRRFGQEILSIARGYPSLASRLGR